MNAEERAERIVPKKAEILYSNKAGILRDEIARQIRAAEVEAYKKGQEAMRERAYEIAKAHSFCCSDVIRTLPLEEHRD